MAYLRAGRDLLWAGLAAALPKVRLTPVEGTFLAWLDMRAYGLSNRELARRLLAENLMLTDGTFFGQAAGEGFMRLNFGCPHRYITEGLARLERALEGAGA